jgi:hypothetical protein
MTVVCYCCGILFALYPLSVTTEESLMLLRVGEKLGALMAIMVKTNMEISIRQNMRSGLHT